jgi:transglutaminase-like putative cysteine protease
MREYKPKLTALLLCVGLHYIAQAQEWKKTFPDAEAIYTGLSCEVEIKMVEGQLTANSNFEEDLLLDTDNAVKMMSRGRVYNSTFNELKKWDAYTRLPESKKIRVANISTGSSRQESIFYDDVKTTSFDFAGVTVGATRHLDYQLQHNDVHLLTPYYFDRYFPVQKGELRIVFPSSVKIKYVVRGLNKDNISFSESRKKDKTIYTFSAKDLPGIRYYSDAPDNSYYATHVVFYIEKIQDKDGWKNFLAGVDDLYQYNYQHIKNINQSLSSELQQLTDTLTKGLTSDREKAKRIYRWVQNNIKYVAFEEGLEGFVPREANLVCSRRFGDCKDMASILTAMLNYAKVPAYFTWIGTRHLPYTYTEFPLPIVDNHMICAAKIDGQYIFLDGTDNGCVFGMPSEGIQDKEALVAINEKEYKVIKVETPPKEMNRYIDSTFIQLDGDVLKGSIKVHMTGYLSSNMWSTLNYKNEKEREDHFRSRLTRGSNKIKFSNWKVHQSEDNSNTWITADFELPGYAKKIGDEWLLNLNIYKFFEHQEIDYPKRKTPIEYPYLNTATYTTVMQLPKGYKVSYLPKSQSYKNDVWGFDMNYAVHGEKVALTQKFDMDYLMLVPGQFEQWNKVLENLFPHYKQTVVVTPAH